MAEAPFLSQEDVRAELAQFHRSNHRSPNTAFFGRGEPGQVEVIYKHQLRQFDIVPVRCELELRQKLQQAETAGRPVALLVDYDQRLPVDVQGRLAKGGLQFISRERRLANLFGVPRVAPALVENPLAEALLRAGWVFPPMKTVPIIDLGTAWRQFLGRAIGLPTEDALTEEAVVDFLALRPPTAADPLLTKLLGQVPKLAAALEEFWGGSVGPVARLCWANWAAGRALDVAAMAFVLDGLMPRREEGAVKVFLSLRLKELGEAKELATGALLSRWARLAPALYLRLGDRAPVVLQKANALVEAPGLDEVLGESRFLAAGFQRTKQELAAQLTSALGGVTRPGAGMVPRKEVGQAEALYRKLSHHHLANAPENAPALARALMGLRLLAFLAVKPDWEAALASATPVEPLFRLAEWFAHEGGFVDLARKLVRGGHDSDPLEAALARVADAADACRDGMDRRFARALALWNEDRRAGRALPIENALAELGVRFLEEGDQRRLLILVMDGMSWASAAEILLDVRDLGYSPLRWQPPRAERPGLPLPMIAALPSMTEISRAALFAGKLLAPGEPTSTTRDPERLLQHKAFVKAFGDGPTLLLRTEAESQTGELTERARKLVQSNERAVGVVVNAVDDQLTSKPGYHVSANRTTIKALQPLLELAREARRAVLLIADHGHVPSTRPHTVVEAAKSENPRFRELDGDAPISDREIVVSGPNAYTGRKGKRLALLVGETDRYVSQRHIGEHGGASLAEIVTPALMLGSQDLRTLVSEEGEALDTVAFPVPAWWHLDVPVDAAAEAPPPPKALAKMPGRSKVPENQLALPVVAPTPIAPPGAPRSRWAVRLGEVFADLDKARKQELNKTVLPALELLVEHNGRLAEEVFAGSLGESSRNVGGRVAIMAEFLNEDGYQVVQYDTAGKQVRLDMALLQELFGG